MILQIRIIALVASVLGVCMACAGAKRALLIGISHYPKYAHASLSWPAIHGANDVALLSPTLRNQGFAVTSLTEFQATAASIRRELKALAANSHAGDLVYIHFSGHGQAYEDLSGDEDDGWDEAIVPYDAMSQYKKGVYEGKNHIIDDELEGYLTAIRRKVGKKGYVYLVLDACHTGGASRGSEMDDDEQQYVRGTDQGFSPHGKKYTPKIDRRGNMKVRSLAGAGGVCILEACRAYQTNTEINQGGKYYGALSYYVNKALRKTALSADTRWTETVRRMMNGDKRLMNQNMVIEKTE